MSALVVASLSGCAVRGNTELLEARLRQQEDRVVRMETELRTAQSELAAARGESQHLREQLAGRGQETLLPEQADSMFRATGIQFNRLLTGGLDRDGVPGDELISAVVVPHDADGELVKLPGRIELTAYDLTQNQEQKLIGKWEYGVEECRGLWHSGFLGSGYLIRVPWSQIPSNAKVLLHARLVTPDGRQFDTSEHVEIEPPHGTAVAKSKPPATRTFVDGPDTEPELRRVGGEDADFAQPVQSPSLEEVETGASRISDGK
ncbi:MAG: hypothetical protein AB7O26_07060 [Planctomycetaceae bacterium]